MQKRSYESDTDPEHSKSELLNEKVPIVTVQDKPLKHVHAVE